jgi:hypothetical protein
MTAYWTRPTSLPSICWNGRMDLLNRYIGVLREGASDAVHFVHHILRELEDLALDEAIREGLETERIMREEVFSIFEGRA